MGFFDELKREMKKAAIEGMRGKPLDDDEDIDSLSFGAEFVKEAVKSANQDTNSSPTNETNGIFCEKCGSRLNSRAMFCSKCGTKVTSSEADDEDNYEEEEDEEEDEEDDDEEDEDDTDDEEGSNTINGLLIKEKKLLFEIMGKENDLIALVSDDDFISESDIKKYNLQVEQHKQGIITVYSSFEDEKFEVLSTFGGGFSEMSRRDITLVDFYYHVSDNGKLIDCAKPLTPFIPKVCAYLNDKVDNKQFFLSSLYVKYNVISSFDQLVALIDKKFIGAITQKEIKTLDIYTENQVDINDLNNGRECMFIIRANVPSYITLSAALNHEINSLPAYSNDNISFAVFYIRQTEPGLFRTKIDFTASLSCMRDDELIDIAEPFKPIIERFDLILQKEGKHS
jgi:uncharacterized Zn finger protein (UPF0148 family)